MPCTAQLSYVMQVASGRSRVALGAREADAPPPPSLPATRTRRDVGRDRSRRHRDRPRPNQTRIEYLNFCLWPKTAALPKKAAEIRDTALFK